MKKVHKKKKAFLQYSNLKDKIIIGILITIIIGLIIIFLNLLFSNYFYMR